MTQAGAELVLAERRGRVLVVTFNRPERLNAWNDDLEERYFALLDSAEHDPEVRAVVVTGAGRGFCAGADMDVLAQIGSGDLDDAPDLDYEPRARHRPLLFGKPLVAAINGAAAGLGFVEALYADVRFATPAAKLTTSFVRRGLIAEYGVAWLLPRIVGQSRALDLLISGRIVLGDEAQAMGLVDRVVDADGLLDAAVAYADDLATWCAPTSVAVIKEQVRDAWSSDLPTAIERSEREMVASFQRTDIAEGVASYLEGRTPDFDGTVATRDPRPVR